ncbi:MAG: hypothetical protein B6I28_06510 [Fusobacteriia bacterium 4572_132]|nr:MAG: hypothetical protein B6I28_06510 [Fusobacteriia bacterium 4572_132]
MKYLNNGTRIIEINEMLDYSECSMKYYYKYINEETKGKYADISEKYDKDIKTTLYSFFINRKLKNEYKLNVLKKSWGSNWIGSKTNKELVFETSGRNSKTEFYRQKGINTIYDVYNYFKDKDIEIIAINEPYKIKIGLVEVKGKWDLIVRSIVSDNVIIFDFRTDKINEFDIKYNIKTTAGALAFEKQFGRKADKLIYYDLNKVSLFIVTRDDLDIKLYKQATKNIVKAIESGIFYVKPNEKCKLCQYKNYCFNSK